MPIIISDSGAGKLLPAEQEILIINDSTLIKALNKNKYYPFFKNSPIFPYT